MPRIRLGMVGGGNDAFIGGVHRIASRIDDRFDLVAGALSSTPEKSAASAEALGIPRSYGSFEEMAEAEAARDDGIEAVSIVTPNHVHAAAAKAFLAKGIHVICDKPLTSTLEDAEALAASVAEAEALFILTHNYTGYPMIRQARAMVAAGDLGEIRIVQAEYPQDWLTAPMENEGVKQAEWRTDPARSGAGGSVGDIGTHAHNLACFVSGLEVESLAADLQSWGAGRQLDDNAHMMLLITRNGAGASEASQSVSRIPGGHPEGYLEGFATIYNEAADAIRAVQGGASRESAMGVLPDITAGMAGMRFINACVTSSANDAAWTKL